MILKWISSLKDSAAPEAISHGANEEKKRIRKLEGRDIAHEVMNLRARKKSKELHGLTQSGTPKIKREKFKSCVKKHVFEIVSETFKENSGNFTEEVTEEITEQIVSAADFDPTYRDIFDEEA